MIGNDVVDILQSRIESNRLRKGFMNKLFNPHEQEMIQLAPDAEQMTWILWSMKEAAYKIYNRQTSIREFIPLSLCCTVEDNHGGIVNCKGNIYFTQTIIAGDIIHTIAVCNKNDFSLVYEPSTFEVAKDNKGMPCAKTGNELVYPASISHHGKHLKIVALKKKLQ